MYNIYIIMNTFSFLISSKIRCENAIQNERLRKELHPKMQILEKLNKKMAVVLVFLFLLLC